MSNYIVYKHTTPSGKVYIGITRQTADKRWKNGKGYKGCTAFYRAVQKYGWASIQHEIVYSNLSHNDACNKEQELIQQYKSHLLEYGYNLTLGGENYEPNEEWRRKASESHLKFFQEHPEARDHISNIQRGRKLPKEQKEKIRNSVLQYFQDHPEHYSECGNSFRGKKRGEAFSKALGERKSKAIICVETGVTYKSLKEASEKLQIGRTGITNVLHGRAKKCGAFSFIFAEAGNG